MCWRLVCLLLKKLKINRIKRFLKFTIYRENCDAHRALKKNGIIRIRIADKEKAIDYFFKIYKASQQGKAPDIDKLEHWGDDRPCIEAMKKIDKRV